VTMDEIEAHAEYLMEAEKARAENG
jgi:hypothetical protein